MEEIRQAHRAVYEANADHWDTTRSRALFEKAWLDRWLAHVPSGDKLIDLGCGAGEPIARYLIEQGHPVTGVDFSPKMLAIARRRFSEVRWIEADMRALDLGECFAGIVAWDSFFHLSKDEQHALIPCIARHIQPGGALLATAGPDESEAVGRLGGGAVFHASLSLAEYAERFEAAAMDIERFVPDDAPCGGHSVLLAIKSGVGEFQREVQHR
jgi:SAM-dependent methyltransferase